MRKNRVVEQNRCYHLVSRLAHRAFFLDDEEKDRAVALMRRVEAGVQASMSYCINRAVSISSDPFDPCKKLLDRDDVDLIDASRVIVRSGDEYVTKAVTEYIYPTETSYGFDKGGF